MAVWQRLRVCLDKKDIDLFGQSIENILQHYFDVERPCSKKYILKNNKSRRQVFTIYLEN